MSKKQTARKSAQARARPKNQSLKSAPGKSDAAVHAFDLDQFLPYLINRTGTTVATAYSAELRRTEITLPMWRVISVLYYAGEQRQIDLSKLTSIKESTLSRLITAMENRSLLSRRRSRSSNREVAIALKSRGRALAKRYIPIARAYEDIASQGLGKADIETTKRCLRRMYDNLDGWVRTQRGPRRAG